MPHTQRCTVLDKIHLSNASMLGYICNLSDCGWTCPGSCNQTLYGYLWIQGYIFRRSPDMERLDLIDFQHEELTEWWSFPHTPTLHLCFAQSQLCSSVELWLLMHLTMPDFPLLAPGLSRKYKRCTTVPCLTWYSVLLLYIDSTTTRARYNYALS